MDTPSEKDRLLTDEEKAVGSYTQSQSMERVAEGVKPLLSVSREESKRSFNMLSNALKEHDANEERKNRLKKLGAGVTSKSFTVSSDGNVSYLTPAEMGRHELYENLPMTAVMGLQKKEKSMSMAFASFAADLDVHEQEKSLSKPMSEADKFNRKSYASLLLMDELGMDSAVVSSPLIFSVLVATLAQFLVGYNTGVMNAPSAVVFEGHSTGVWAIAVSSFAVGAPLGANVAGDLAETRGRRGALLLSTWTFVLGGLVQTFALDMFSIIIARFIIGIASGISSVLVPIYLGEIAPPTLRGMLGTLTQFALVIGILISDLLSFPFATVNGWRMLFAVTPIIAVAQLALSTFLLESPRWLLGRDKNSRKARYVIKKLRGLRYDHEVDTEVGHYIAAQEAQESHQGKATKVTFKNLIQDSSIRLLLISCLVLQMAQQLCGINAVFYYSNLFFEGVIDNPLVGTTVVGGVNVLATYAALLLMDSCGRRTLILWSSGGMFVCCVLIVLSLMHILPNLAALVSVNLYVGFFEIGLGPIPWLIVAEMFDARYVAIAMSACCQLNWACNIVIGLTFPFLVEYLGPFSFVPFAIVLLFTFLFAAFWLPETHGTTPEELQEKLVKKNSSTVYHNIDIANTIGNPIDLEWKMAMDQLRKDEESSMKEGSYN